MQLYFVLFSGTMDGLSQRQGFCSEAYEGSTSRSSQTRGKNDSRTAKSKFKLKITMRSFLVGAKYLNWFSTIGTFSLLRICMKREN